MTRSLHSLIQYLCHNMSHQGDAALSDAQLLERWIEQHDPAAFELMLWRHGPMVLNTCRRLLARREDIEDTFQATFLVLVRKAGSIRRREALAAWLHRVACRIAARVRITNSLRSSREQPFADALTTPRGDAPAVRDLHAILDEEIDSLPAHYRRALVLCCLEGKSQEEAAKLLDRPRGTVSSWQTRGRERLRQRLLRRGIVVSTAGLAATLTPDALASGGMIPLLGSLVRMAGAVACGGTVPTGLMSARTIALAEGVLRMMFMTKVKIVASITLVVALAAVGVGTWSHATRAAENAPTPQQAPKQPQKNGQNPFVELSKDLNAAWTRGLKLKEQDGIAWGEPVHGLQAGIAFRRGDQETHEVSQSVTFVVYLRSVSNKKINLSHIEPMFEESVAPAVEDANGKRLAVAIPPIKLGEVPIVHRSLEAGERITLGYPWFRIRPLGWHGEVVGPTCCAEPGRYKLGFTSLVLRLDDGKDISLSTKQVELHIRKHETAREDRTTREEAAVEQPVTPGIKDEDETSLYYVAQRSLKIPIRIDPKKTGADEGRALRLLVSRDRGHTWQLEDRATSTEQSFNFKAPEDGIYWFIIQTEDKQGRCTPANPERVKPSMCVCIDTTAPKVTLFRPVLIHNAVHFGWTAKDANLADNPITLEWAEHKKGPWCLIGQRPNSGFYAWRLPNNILSQVYLRIRVRDKAGNEACATTDKPISLTLEQIRRLEALLEDEEVASRMSENEREEIAFRVADGYFNLNEYDKAIQKYEEIAKMWDQKPAGLRGLAGTIRCFGCMGDSKQCRQQARAIRDRLPTIRELTDEQRQQWSRWLDGIENGVLKD